MIVVTAKIKAKQGSEKDLEAAFRKMVTDVASEEETLMYTLHRSQKDPAVFMFYEKYKDLEAFKLHSITPHFNALMQTIQPMLDGAPDIELFDELAKLSK
jgi:quinol monooxygenase YgiN